MDCVNFMLAAPNFSLIGFLKLKYYGKFNYITQIVHLNAHLNPLKGIFTHNFGNFNLSIGRNFQFPRNASAEDLNFFHVFLNL